MKQQSERGYGGHGMEVSAGHVLQNVGIVLCK